LTWWLPTTIRTVWTIDMIVLNLVVYNKIFFIILTSLACEPTLFLSWHIASSFIVHVICCECVHVTSRLFHCCFSIPGSLFCGSVHIWHRRHAKCKLIADVLSNFVFSCTYFCRQWNECFYRFWWYCVLRTWATTVLVCFLVHFFLSFCCWWIHFLFLLSSVNLPVDFEIELTLHLYY